MRDIPIVPTSEEITAHWLSSVVGHPVHDVGVTPIGAGQLGRTYRVAFSGQDPTAPCSLVVKLASDDEVSRSTGVALKAYLREIAFYRQFGGRFGREVPTCHAAVIDDNDEWFTLVIDDRPNARTFDQLDGCDQAHAAAALTALARVQGPLLGDHVLGASPHLNLPWPLNQALYNGVLPGFVARFGDRLEPQHLDLCTWFAEHVDAWLADRRPPLGLVHGDFRLDNLLYDDDCTIVDWQTVSTGPAMRDASYFVASSFKTDDRRMFEQQLLRDYVTQLNSFGNSTLSWDDAWEGYRHQSLFGVLMSVVAPMVVEATERGDAMFTAMIRRHAAHAVDLDARSLIEGASAGALLPRASDEGLHRPGAGLLWSESFYFDAISADGKTGAYVRLGRLPNQQLSIYTAAVVRRGAPTAMVVDAAAPLPTEDDPDQTVRTDMFTASQTCVDPLRSYRVRLTGKGESFMTPAGPLDGTPGAPIDVAIDLVWTTDATPYQWRLATRYEIPCRVSGTVTVGDDIIAFEGPGQRDHSWGNRDWWSADWSWSAIHLDDGTRVHAVAVYGLPDHSVGYAQKSGEVVEFDAVNSTHLLDPDGTVTSSRLETSPGDLAFDVHPVAFGSLRLVSPQGCVTHFQRAMCDVTTPDGRAGVGWVEWNLVQPQVEATAAP